MARFEPPDFYSTRADVCVCGADVGPEPHRIVPFPAGYPVPPGTLHSRPPLGEQRP